VTDYHSWAFEWWRSGRVHTLVGPAHNTSGAPIYFEIPSTFAWGRKVPSIHSVLQESGARVLSMERLCTSGGGRPVHSAPFLLHILGAIWRL